MRKKREAKLEVAYKKAKKDIGHIHTKNLFLAGFFLYWAEGTKTARSTTCLTNTDPIMLKFFISWLRVLGVNKNQLRVRLHLYSDMNISKETRFWSKGLGIPVAHFRKTYVKKTTIKALGRKGGFGHGTCDVLFGNQALSDYILMGIKYIREKYQ